LEAFLPFIGIAIAIVLVFDYTNGFNDASNIIASTLASRSMTPIQAVLVVASFHFLGPLLGGGTVANTIIGTLINFLTAPKADELPTAKVRITR
jgi:PiT family inorganic phosphate transporter